MLWIKVGSVECCKLVDWAACVIATKPPGAVQESLGVLKQYKEEYCA